MSKPKAKRLAVEKSISTFPPKLLPVIKKPARPAVVRTKPDGWFVPSWPPGFISQIKTDRNGHLAQATAKSREVSSSTGVGWGIGTVVMRNTPKLSKRPQWLKKEKA